MTTFERLLRLRDLAIQRGDRAARAIIEAQLAAMFRRAHG